MKPTIFVHFILLLFAASASAKEVVYNLTIAGQELNITGKAKMGMTVNGGIPGPTVRFREGGFLQNCGILP